MAASVRSSPLAALGVLVACLAMASLARTRDEPTPVRPTSAAQRARSVGLVDLNTATAAELETLPRIGPTLAARILEHRRVHGPFTRVEDLDAVSGIGPATLSGLRGRVTISPPERDGPALLAPEPPR